jgi:hypothetical protein
MLDRFESESELPHIFMCTPNIDRLIHPNMFSRFGDKGRVRTGRRIHDSQ